MRPLFKYLIYGSVALVIVASVLFWFGGRKQKISYTVRIKDSRAEVFRHLTDPELIKEWAKDVVSIEPLTEGGHREGAQARMTIESEGRTLVFTDEVLATAKDQSLLLVRSNSDFLEYSSDYRLNESGDTTELTVHVEYRFLGIYRFLGVVPGPAKAILEEDMEKLKKDVESTENLKTNDGEKASEKNKPDSDDQKKQPAN